MLATQAASAATTTTTSTTKQPLENSSRATTPIKMERRDSTTSESSLEHLDLGRTPKKLNTHSSATSTPHLVNGLNAAVAAAAVAADLSAANAANTANTHEALLLVDGQKKLRLQPRLHDSDEANDYDEDDSADEKLSSARSQRHHKRRSSGRLDKRACVQLEYNADNPNSLRKKFRFNRSISEAGHAAAAATNTSNESGFVDASCSSQYLNASAASAHATNSSSAAQQPQTSPHLNSASHSSSSASSSPHGGTGAASSPESGIGERDDMKYVCPICEVVSASPHEFTNHIRCHNYASGDTENFTCRICSKVLSSASSLDRHVLVHTGERPFNCKYCHLTFTTNGNMHRHMRTHKQHQHNHHHRRNSNGTKNNNNNNSSSTSVGNAGTAQTTPATASAASMVSTAANAQLTNGNSSEGVKTASTSTAAAAAATKLTTAATTTTTLSALSLAAAAAGANGKRLNGSGVESYESDGGCSTDSSSAISQSSNHHQQHNNNHNNNNNSIKSNNINNNNNNNNNIVSNNFKRKNSDHLEIDDVALLKRRVKTTINSTSNNNNNNNITNADLNASSTTTAATDDFVAVATPTCPVCSAADFDGMLSLGTHMDAAHSDIPAKCRNCDVVFRTHRQLNVHPCTHKPNATSSYKDMTFVDFSSEKFPLIAKSLCEQTLRTAIAGQRFECPKCCRDFPSASACELHVQECEGEVLNRYQAAASSHDFSAYLARRSKQRSVSESSADAEDCEEDAHSRNEFFRHLHLRNKPMRSQSMNSLSSAHHSNDEHLDNIKYEVDSERLSMSHNMLSQEAHDSKDFADIQTILNMTSSSSTSNFLKNFEQSVNTPSSNYSLDKDEEEAQDAFTSEFRKMKMRGEFPCKLCTAVFPNLRALKGHNRIHLSAVGPAGPFRCNMCPYSICDKAALVRHMRTHNGDRPYECAVCNYAFTTKANCERHLRNRHAKTTRDEVKRAIIYHPSEDSSCDDPNKKMHMFSSPDFDDDCDLPYQHHHPKDRSTPVSHLKEMLTGESPTSKPLKIQVKSLEQLLDKSPVTTNYNETYDSRQSHTARAPDSAPIDLSMDVLDLSKKQTSKPVEKVLVAPRPPTPPVALVAEIEPAARPAEDPKFDLAALEKNHHLFLAQQQLMNDALPKIVDPAQYIQQLYRNLVFPPINPFFLQNSFLPNNLSDLQKFAPLMSHMFGGNATATGQPMPTIDANKPHSNSSTNSTAAMLPQVSPLMSDKSSTPTHSSASPASMSQMLPKSLASPTPSNASLNIPRHPHMAPNVLSGGPVKMVIKNGVLMPKQKQRRYRTERPFACDHCSARFTLRSNMERHVKQQHPQFYAQRQRSGHHIMRGRGASSAAAMNNITHLQAAFAQAHNNGGGSNIGSSPISEQVKYAILAQQLKARKDTDLLQQALAHGSSSIAPNHMLIGATGTSGLSSLPNGQQFNFNHMNSPNMNAAAMEDDEPKLIIDEDEDYDDVETIPDDNDEPDIELDESYAEEPLPMPVEEEKSQANESNQAAKKVAETILEQAIKAGKNTNTIAKPDAPAPAANTMKSMIAQAESVGKFLKEVASSPFKDESQDLVPVSKLVDNATSNSVSFNNYFRPSDVANHMEQSDEEGLVASGSASESNNSGTEDIATSAEPKKKSAYSLAPNRVSCPYCQRMFPWSSSLRRHILTHTGQKPFKCSHCPLLFTTKSNCDRHLLRKHGNVESAVSVYVPTEDVNEPIPVPKSVEEIEQQQRKREQEERRRKAEEAQQLERERREKEQQRQLQQQKQQQLQEQEQQQQQQQLLKQLAAAQLSQLNAAVTAASSAGSSPKNDASLIASSDLPFKCHLCESSFGERFQCLEHIKIQHAQEFALLLAKGAIDTDADINQMMHVAEDEDRRGAPAGEENSAAGRNGTGGGGKYPDYSNRKVICAFCVRRFWSTEDLRRHMRTHSGERPFQCEICLRKFTLKHSMLRHMKKHNGRHHNGSTAGDLSAAGNSGSDFSDDEQTPTPTPAATPTLNSMMITAAANHALSMRAPKIQELLNKANEWRASRMTSSSLGGEHKENIAEEHNQHQSDLIGNLLGISDQGILNKLLSSADEAAKLLGVEK